MASHAGHRELTDLGNIVISGHRLEEAQQALRDAVLTCQQAGKRTLVLGGGHETAYGHGLGVLDAFPQKKSGLSTGRAS